MNSNLYAGLPKLSEKIRPKKLKFAGLSSPFSYFVHYMFWFFASVFSPVFRVGESTAGYMFTPCESYFTSPGLDTRAAF